MTREEAIKIIEVVFKDKDTYKYYDSVTHQALNMAIEALSADAVHIHNDGTLEVKLPNAQKVGRVLVMDTDSHIGGGLFYQDDAVQGEWITCSEKLPSDDEIVNITWVNHNPPPYYADIEGKPFVASGLRYRDKWYWYSSVCQDLHQDFDLIDKDIEVIAWQPLPKPYGERADKCE